MGCHIYFAATVSVEAWIVKVMRKCLGVWMGKKHPDLIQY